MESPFDWPLTEDEKKELRLLADDPYGAAGRLVPDGLEATHDGTILHSTSQNGRYKSALYIPDTPNPAINPLPVNAA